MRRRRDDQGRRARSGQRRPLPLPLRGTGRRDRALTRARRGRLTISTSRRQQPASCGRLPVSPPASRRSRSAVSARGSRSGSCCSAARFCSRSVRSRAPRPRPSRCSPPRRSPSVPRIAILTTAGTLAAAEWVPAERRAATLSWALIGQPAAWIVGMPLLGAAGGAQLALRLARLPLAAALLAGAAVAGRGGSIQGVERTACERSAPRPRIAAGRRGDADNSGLGRDPRLRGRSLRRVVPRSSALTGAVLAVGAGAYVSGNFAFRTRSPNREPANCSIPLAGVLAVATALFGALRPSLRGSALLFWLPGSRPAAARSSRARSG